MRRTVLLLSSVLAAAAASLCCILPLVAAVTGFGALAAAAQWESSRPYLLGVTAVLLVSGLLLVHRDSKAACVPGEACASKGSGRWNILAVVCIAGLVIGIASFPYYSGTAVLAMNSENEKQKGKGAAVTKTLTVTGMTCPACASGLEASFRNLPGVKEAKIDYNAKRATITYDPAKQTLQDIKKLITDSGYQVKE
ncbi:MAG: heavy-metal-associated domain-containing protein [Acidobacteria bacterium]|nr:heavy-metal-associated domain-containing protein [Acidobacteriota bacterium]